MYRKRIGPTAHGVIDYAFATLNTLRASVGSTDPLFGTQLSLQYRGILSRKRGRS
jgi:hypothetical protein